MSLIPLEPRQFNRRNFLAASTATVAAAVASSIPTFAEPWPPTGRNLVSRNSVILFQGDSITDFGRSREKADVPNLQPGLGNGYAWYAAAELLVGHPEQHLTIYNRGVSGNKVFQLADRWQADCLDLKPDLLSILVGVNDLWHTLDPKLNYKGTVEVYEHDYDALLDRTRRALPKTKLLICEPFVLRCGAVSEKWFPEFDKYRAAAKRVAQKHRATFLPFQTMFDEAVKYAPPNHWAADGVHPTAAGAALMAHFWVKAVGA